MDAKLEYPAVVVLSRGPTQLNTDVFVCQDGQILTSDRDVTTRLQMFATLEALGGVHYRYTVTPLAEVEATKAALLAELAPEPEAMTEAEALAKAHDLAAAAFDGDKPTLARLARAVKLAEAGAVESLDNGQYRVSSQSNGGTYTVNGACTCPDATQNGRTWCKHRLAVALTVKAQALQNENEAGIAANNPASETAPRGDNAQTNDNTTLDWAQIRSIEPRWGGSGVTVFYTDGRHEKRTDLDYSETAQQAQASGFTRNGSQGCCIRPKAHETALPAEHSRGRSKLFKS